MVWFLRPYGLTNWFSITRDKSQICWDHKDSKIDTPHCFGSKNQPTSPYHPCKVGASFWKPDILFQTARLSNLSQIDCCCYSGEACTSGVVLETCSSKIEGGPSASLPSDLFSGGRETSSPPWDLTSMSLTEILHQYLRVLTTCGSIKYPFRSNLPLHKTM